MLATTIAETSLTIEGIGIVVDSGLKRVPRFDARRGMTELVTVRVSRAALERAGAQLKSAEVALDLADAEYVRAEHLVQKNALSKSDLDSKRMQKRTREEEVRRDRSAEEVARFELEQALIAAHAQQRRREIQCRGRSREPGRAAPSS